MSQGWRDTQLLQRVLHYLRHEALSDGMHLCGSPDGNRWLAAQLQKVVVHSWSEARLRAHPWSLLPLAERVCPPLGQGVLAELWWAEVPLLWSACEGERSEVALAGVVWVPVERGRVRPAAFRGADSGWVTVLFDARAVPVAAVWWPSGMTALTLAAKMTQTDPWAASDGCMALWLAAVMWREASVGGEPPVVGDDGVRYWALPEEWRC